MPVFSRGRPVARLAIAAAGAAAMLLASSGVALAGYGPGGGSPAPPGGGYYCVVTSQTVGASGRSIGPLTVGPLHVTLHVPPGDLSSATQVTVTEPEGQGSSCGGGATADSTNLSSLHRVGGVGVLLQRSGSRYSKRLSHPINIDFTSRQIGKHSEVEVYRNGQFTVDNSATERRHFAEVNAYTSADFLVLSRGKHQKVRTAASRSGTSRAGHRGAVTAARGPATSLAAQARLLPRDSQATGLGVLTVRSAAGTADARSARAIRG